MLKEFAKEGKAFLEACRIGVASVSGQGLIETTPLTLLAVEET